MTQQATPPAWVGTSVPRKEDARLVSGRGLFADDAAPAGVLHCAILRSPHPHARILRVDCERARSLPGVVAALSGAEAKEVWGPLPPNFQFPGMRLPTVYALAVDRVLYEGEPVAAVAAESRYAAEDALAAIDVAYEPLPVVATVEDALRGDVRLYEDWPDNLQVEWPFAIGDVEGAFAAADLVVHEKVATHRYGTMPLEPRAVLAEFDPVQRQLTVRLSTQVPHQAAAAFAQIFHLPATQVRVLTQDVGGGFGGKGQADGDVIPMLLSIVTGRPVKWAETRWEWLLAGPAGCRGYEHDIEMALDADGHVLAVRDRLLADAGCDGIVRAIGLGALIVGGTYVPGPYRVPAFAITVQAAVTNKAPYGAYRGYGKDIASLAMERMLDLAADRAGLDRVEIRRRNLVDEFPYEMCSGPVIENGSFRECLDTLVQAMDLPALRRRQAEARDEGRFLGIGVVSRLEPSAGAIPMSMFSGVESATVRLHPDGSASALTGIQPIGQGVETAYAQVVADRLGLAPEEVRIVYGDTDAVPFGQGSFASRGATFGVASVHESASRVREKLLRAAGNLLEVDPLDLDLGGGRVWPKGSPDRSLTIREIAQAAYFFPGPYAVLPGEDDPVLEATCVYTNPAVNWVPDEHGRMRIYPTHGSGAEGALVEVDPETGQVRVEKIWFVHDSGVIINPQIVEGQLRGGIVQAVGGTMFEQLAYDGAGHPLTRTLGDYQLPNVLSAPDVELHHLETPSPLTPLGTKGVGEGGHIGTSPVLMAALEDALHPFFRVQVLDTPLTPPRVLAMIERAHRG